MFLIIGITGNILLMTLGHESWSPYLIVVCSITISFLGYKNYKKTDDIKLKELDQNIKEAQKIISENAYGVFRYGKSFNLNINTPPLGFSLREIIVEPFIWILSISLMAAFFFSSAYLAFDVESIKSILKLSLVTFLQILFLSFAITGIYISILKKVKGQNK